MALASEIKIGQVIQLEGQNYRVAGIDAHLGGGRMGSLVKMRIENIETRAVTDRRFRPEDKIETVELEKKRLSYLYTDGDTLYFMDPSTYEQYPIPSSLLGKYLEFLKDGEELAVEFLKQNPVRVITPNTVELVVASTAPPQHAQETNVWKEATLENGVEIQVPLFIATGDKIVIDLETGKYHDRAR